MFLTISGWSPYHTVPGMRNMPGSKCAPGDNQTAAHNINKNREADTVPPDLPFSGRSHHPQAEAAPGLPAYPEHPITPSAAPLPCRYPRNTVPDAAPVSSVQRHSPRTWTYGLHYRLPSLTPAQTYRRFRSPVRQSGWQCPSAPGSALWPDRSHRSRHGLPDHVQCPQNAASPTCGYPPPSRSLPAFLS